jgi:regulator of sirC expression with transglutaminase-like and TPR domain
VDDAPDPFAALAASLVRDPACRVNLAEAACWLAADFDPALDVPAQLLRLDDLADQARTGVQLAWSDEARVRALNRFLFEQEGFHGNTEHYEDPRNSLLPDVLERRTGLPITLSLVYLELGWRLGLPVEGVGFPGHFLVRYRGREDLMVDSFHAKILDDEALTALLHQALGRDAVFRRAQLQPSDPSAFLVRLLSNLKRHQALAGDFGAALRCCERLLQLQPDDPLELRDRGLMYERLECWDAARSDLEHFLQLRPGDASAEAVRDRLQELSGRRSLLH